MSDRTLQTVLDALCRITRSRPEQSGSGWTACCPAHDDQRPSLSIAVGDDGRVLLHCHAGCSAESVVEAIGLTMADLYRQGAVRNSAVQSSSAVAEPKRACKAYPTPEAAINTAARQARGEHVHTWTYRYGDGREAFRVARFDLADGSKQFRPIHKATEGWCIADPPGPLPLYRLPELAGASRVYVCEGEKPADAARSIGLTATTSAHGSKAAAKTDWTPLANREVVNLQDNDDAGRKYVQAVAAIVDRLRPAPLVKIVHLPGLPDGGDIAEFIEVRRAAGLDDDAIRSEVEALAEAAAPWTPAEPADLSAHSSLLSQPPWPDALDQAAFHGVVGELVRKIEPHTEADPAALLIQSLVGIGNIVGRNIFFVADGTRHYCNLFACLVGETAKSRKGTSWSHTHRVLSQIENAWTTKGVASGLSSGEGLIWAVRDPIVKRVPVKKKGRFTGEHDEVIEDHGVEDKRLLIQEGEFARVLKVLGREGNTLSAVIRSAWDSGRLRILTKTSPAVATDAHISIVGHITRDELRRLLSDTESGNGFGNRYLWVCARRSKYLPDGGHTETEDFSQVVQRLSDAVSFARNVLELRRDPAAREIWHRVYSELSEGKPGLIGAVISRAEAQVMRLASIYAVLDRSELIRAEHLMAALAVWEYCEASARHIFGDKIGDPVADELLRAVQHSPDGLTRTDIHGLFKRHKSADRINEALDILCAHDRVRRVVDRTHGRSAERWVAVPDTAKEAKEAKKPRGPGFPSRSPPVSHPRR